MLVAAFWVHKHVFSKHRHAIKFAALIMKHNEKMSGKRTLGTWKTAEGKLTDLHNSTGCRHGNMPKRVFSEVENKEGQETQRTLKHTK